MARRSTRDRSSVTDGFSSSRSRASETPTVLKNQRAVDPSVERLSESETDAPYFRRRQTATKPASATTASACEAGSGTGCTVILAGSTTKVRLPVTTRVELGPSAGRVGLTGTP